MTRWSGRDAYGCPQLKGDHILIVQSSCFNSAKRESANIVTELQQKYNRRLCQLERRKIMKRKIFCAFFAFVLTFAFAVNAFAATLNTSYSGSCYRAFTPSGYLQRSSSDALWSWLKVDCTKCQYEGADWNDHLLKIYNSTGGAAAENTYVYERGYNPVYLYSGQTGTTKITFKVYNSYYYEKGDDSYKMQVAANVAGYLDN